MIQIIKDLIKSSDYFAKNVELIFNKKTKFPTYLGGVLTLIILASIIMIVYNMGQELVERKSPKTNINSVYKAVTPSLYLNSLDSTTFSFHFTDKDMNPLYDESFFGFEIQLFSMNINKDTGIAEVDYQPLKLENCSKLKHYFVNQNFNLSDQFDSNNLQYSFCITNQSFSVGGSMFYDYFQRINLIVYKCDNITSKNTCKTIEEIDDRMSGGYFQFYYIDRYLDAVDYSLPLKPYLSSYYIELDPLVSKSSDFYFKMVNVSSDYGVIFQQISKTYSIVFDYFREQFSMPKSSNIILTFTINSSVNGVFITRYYMKLGDLAATVGGILQVFILIGTIISDQFNKYKMYEKIMNNLYEFNIEDQYFQELIVKKITKSVYANEINRKQNYIEDLKEKIKNNKNYEEILFKDFKIPNLNIENKNKSCRNFFVRETDMVLKNDTLKEPYNKDDLRKKFTMFTENNFNHNPKLHNENLILDSEMILKNITFKQNIIPHVQSNLNTESNLLSCDRNDELYHKNTVDKLGNHSHSNKSPKVIKTMKNNVFYIELLNKIEHYKKTSNGKLKITYCDIIGIILCRKCVKGYKKKFNLLSKTEKEMNKFIDYIEIAKLLQEFTKLKLVLLSDKQLSLFSFISKPQIFYKDNTVKNSFLHGKIFEKTNIDLHSLYENYISTKEQGKQMSLIDDRIIEYLDEDLKKTFELALNKSKKIEDALNS